MNSRPPRSTRPSLAPPPSVRPSVAPPLPGIASDGPLRKRSISAARTWLASARRVETRELFKQINEVGFNSLFFLSITLGFVGAILVYQAGVQALRIVPDTTNVGASYLELLIRDLAASVTGLMLATRVGAGIAAEIGSMKVTDQLDALRLCHTDPVEYLIIPRVVASFIMTPLLTIVAGTVAAFTGAVTGYLTFGINPAIFLDLRYVDGADLGVGLTKALAFGVAIPVISGHAGMRARAGAEGVGDATTSAVVGSSLAVIVLGFFIGALGQLLLG